MAVALGLNPIQAQTTESAEPVKPITAATITEPVVTLDTYVVTGLRASMAKAIEIKRVNIGMVDAIVAEDIGKFPDNNVVEALQRVPGVQVTDYGAGQISKVTIRGLDDVTTTLNGRNIFTASGLALSLPDMPASLLSEVDVKKTRAASDIESGIAGVIDIKTHRPFDFAGSKISLTAKGTYQQQGGKYDPNISALFSNRWKVGSTGKFGALLNLSFLTTTYRDQSATAGAQVPFINGNPPPGSGLVFPYERLFSNWQPGTDLGIPTAPNSTLTFNGVAVPYILARDAVFFNDSKGKTTRPAANLSLQFAPNDKSEYTFEVFYDGYRNKVFSNLLFSFDDWWVNNTTPDTYKVTLYPGTNIVQRRAYVGDVYSFTSGDYVTGKTDSVQVSLGGKWKISPSFNLSSELVYQNSEFNRTNFFVRGVRNSRVDVDVNYNPGDGIATLHYLDVAATPSIDESKVSNPALWNLGHLWDQGFKNKGDAITFTEEGVLKVDWGIIKKLKFGVRYDDRKASEAARFREADPLVGTTLAALNTSIPGIVSVNDGFFDGRSAGVPSTWASVNGTYANDHADQVRALYGLSKGSTLTLNKSFDVDEATTAAYLQVDEYNADVAGHRLYGQFGLRFVNIRTDMNFTDQNTFAITSGHAGVSKLLPSGIINFEITRSLIARLAYGETIRRPGFNDLNPLIRYTRDVTNIGYGTAGGGNPNLKPTTSKNYDFALEYYLDDATSFNVNLFKRKIDGLVVGFRKRVTYTDAIGPYDYILSQPDNASNGDLEGIEIGGKFFPKNLPGVLDGFGLEASYTHLKSSQDIPLTNSAGVVTGTYKTEFFSVSPDSYSVTLAYEKSKFSARASYTWRSGFLHHNEAALFANPLGVYNSAERSLNAQLSYNLNKNCVITLEGTNLTNDVMQSHYGNQPGNSTTNNFGSWIIGRSVAVSARYSF